jgi:hypothetical protein
MRVAEGVFLELGGLLEERLGFVVLVPHEGHAAESIQIFRGVRVVRTEPVQQ